MERLTRAELKEELKDVKAYIGERVGLVDEKVDKLNGRILTHDRELAEKEARMRALEAFRASIDIVDAEDLTSPESAVITRRDMKTVAWTIVGLGTIIFGWQQALEVFLAYLKASIR